MASTAAPSAAFLSPRPIQRPAASAAASVARIELHRQVAIGRCWVSMGYSSLDGDRRRHWYRLRPDRGRSTLAGPAARRASTRPASGQRQDGSWDARRQGCARDRARVGHRRWRAWPGSCARARSVVGIDLAEPTERSRRPGRRVRRRRSCRPTCATRPRCRRGRAAVAEHGRLDAVVNAAGVAGGGPAHLRRRDEWHRVIDVNLTGTFLVVQARDRADARAAARRRRARQRSSTSRASKGSRAPRAAARTTRRRAAS